MTEEQKAAQKFANRLDRLIAKRGENAQLTADVAKDFAVDKAIEIAPQAAITAVGKLEQGRSFLQQGTVPNATANLARAKAETKAAGKLLSGLRRAPAVQASIELVKGANLIGKEGARAGHAEAGDELKKKPLAYQVANLYVSPADALSKYGASREAAGKKAFEERYAEVTRKMEEAEEKRRYFK